MTTADFHQFRSWKAVVMVLMVYFSGYVTRSYVQNGITPPDSTFETTDDMDQLSVLISTWKPTEKSDVVEALRLLGCTSYCMRDAGIVRDVKLGLCLDFLNRAPNILIIDIDPLISVFESKTQSSRVLDLVICILNRCTDSNVSLPYPTAEEAENMQAIKEFNHDHAVLLEKSIRVWRESFQNLGSEPVAKPKSESIKGQGTNSD